jgi:response regulator RpfG family c-di-GMP phosphodiesterase
MNRPFSKRIRPRKKTVLLVEEPSASRERHAQTLARNGYAVTMADSIESAEELYAPHQYRLLVVSLNGFGDAAAEFCNQVKERDASQLIALIFHPDQELPPTNCTTIIFTTEPDEYFLARVETLTSAVSAA